MANDQFPFMQLPPELREQIWLMTAPDTRVFHVKQSVPVESGPAKGCNDEIHHMVFHNRHAPPALTQVCTESRDAAVRTGFFRFDQPGPTPGSWFNPNRDIVYFDKYTRHALVGGRGAEESELGEELLQQGKELVSLGKVPELRRVQDVGMQRGGGLNLGWPVELSKGDEVREFWAAVVNTFKSHMPAVRAVHYMHLAGVDTGDGEKMGSEALEIILEPMPEGMYFYYRRLNSPYWADVRAEFVKALDSLDCPGDGGLAVVGWRMSRATPLRGCEALIRAQMLHVLQSRTAIEEG